MYCPEVKGDVSIEVVRLEDGRVRRMIHHGISERIAHVHCPSQPLSDVKHEAHNEAVARKNAGYTLHTVSVQIVAGHIAKAVSNRTMLEADQLTNPPDHRRHHAFGHRLVRHDPTSIGMFGSAEDTHIFEIISDRKPQLQVALEYIEFGQFIRIPVEALGHEGFMSEEDPKQQYVGTEEEGRVEDDLGQDERLAV